MKLHVCSVSWMRIGAHPCYRVQKALDDKGIAYELVKHPASRRNRGEIRALSGQDRYPVLELDDGSIYREESKAMAETIRAGRLDEKRGSQPGV